MLPHAEKLQTRISCCSLLNALLNIRTKEIYHFKGQIRNKYIHECFLNFYTIIHKSTYDIRDCSSYFPHRGKRWHGMCSLNYARLNITFHQRSSSVIEQIILGKKRIILVKKSLSLF